MNTLEYFMAHAPGEPQDWFEPVMDDKKPEYDDDPQGFLKKQETWMAEFRKQLYLQWPLAWAQEMVKRIPVNENASRVAAQGKIGHIPGIGDVILTAQTNPPIRPETLPPRLFVGRIEWIQEKNNPEWYNVNGRSYFERIHWSAFPSDAIIPIDSEAESKQTKSAHYNQAEHGSAITEEPRFEDLLKFVFDQKNLRSNSPYNRSMFGYLENALLDVKNFLGRP